MFGPRETVARLRDTPGGVDQYGDPIASTTASVDLPDCLVAPRYSTEPTERGRQGVIVGLALYRNESTDLLHTDRIVRRGETFTVEGDVGDWGVGIEVALKRAVG